MFRNSFYTYIYRERRGELLAHKHAPTTFRREVPCQNLEFGMQIWPVDTRRPNVHRINGPPSGQRRGCTRGRHPRPGSTSRSRRVHFTGKSLNRDKRASALPAHANPCGARYTDNTCQLYLRFIEIFISVMRIYIYI